MTRRAILGLIVLGLAIYGIALLATFPAARALAIADAPVQAAGVEGSVWSGSAARVDIGAPVPLTDLHWDTVAWRLLTGEFAADARFHAAGARMEGRFATGVGGPLIGRDITLRGPAQSLAQLAEIPLVIDGEVAARIDKVRLREGLVRRLDGRFQWRDARLVAPIGIDLGTVSGRIQPTGEDVHELKLQAQGGQVTIDGDIRLFTDGRYEIDLTLAPASDAPAHIADTLALIARRTGDGDYVIRRSGRL